MPSNLILTEDDDEQPKQVLYARISPATKKEMTAMCRRYGKSLPELLETLWRVGSLLVDSGWSTEKS